MGYHLRRLAGEDAPSRYSFRVVRANGSILWLEANPIPITWEGAPAFMAFATDITDRKRAEDQLRAALAEKEVAEQRLKESEQRFREIASLVPQFIYEIDLTGKFTFLNQAAADCTGYTAKDYKAGTYFQDVFGAADHKRMAENIAKIMRGEESQGNEYACIRKDGTTFPILAYSSPIIREGKAVGVRGVAVDISQLKRAEELIRAALEEKEVLLREIHHRVKNNLAVISSLLSLQSEQADEPHRRMFEECRGRIRSMALAHELLYQSENVARIHAMDYLPKLARHLSGSSRHLGATVALQTDIEDISFDLETAVPMGFIATELLSNCFKHAFIDRMEGVIRLGLRSIEQGRYELIVSDNGSGIPEGVGSKGRRSVGLDLVNIFARQLHGTVEIVRDRGTSVQVVFWEYSGGTE
jgi:PAS domain S-box-containing protein